MYRTGVLESEVIKPLLLWLLDPEQPAISLVQFNKALDVMESWMVRRMLIRATTKDYNQVIAELIALLHVSVELRSFKQDASLDEHVFSYARTGLKLTTFRHAWEGACQAAKISGLRFHDLRHTFAARLRGRGVHEMGIMTLLGHTTLQMTSRYSHAMPEPAYCG